MKSAFLSMSDKKNLVIVESPAKAKTIGKYLGKNFVVKSSFGHIRDLPKKGLSIDVDHNFEPSYEIPADKSKIVKELRQAAKAAEVVWLASDEDREGEAIAWHLSEALRLKPNETKRIVFHEITEPAIKAAITSPRNIDLDLVNAQQARRVLDRLVGYELSPVLWKKIQPKLSGGRVQSVAVRLIVEREREIRAFEPTSSYKVTAIFTKDEAELPAELGIRLSDTDTVLKFLDECRKAQFKVTDITEKPSERNPSAPFTTSTLQQEAARRLGFSVKQTMTLAQRLYENGHITYMRTDSTQLSTLAVQAAASYINSRFGGEYLQSRQFPTKNASAQEAHEAIRPTNVSTESAGDDSGQQKLYQLIWRRLVASQMAAAKTLKTDVNISISNQTVSFKAKGEVLLFDGFIKVYGGGRDDAILPKLAIGDQLLRKSISAHQTFSRPPARYSEAGLVKTLEELGIGRPSTYAPIINTIQTRGYVEKVDLSGDERNAQVITLVGDSIEQSNQNERFGADKDKLLPTHLADVTTDFLIKYFDMIIDPSFTASVEKQLDRVAEKQLVWQTAIKNFYDRFHPLIIEANQASRSEASQARLIGTDPQSGLPIYARFGKYGPMLQKGDVEKGDKKPDFAPMPNGAHIDDINLEQALEMFNLPRRVGSTADGQDIDANIGRFGPYIAVGKIFVSIKPLDPLTITEAEARALYQNKIDQMANREIKQLDNLQVLRGPYGPYVTDGKKNARIPKTIDPVELSLEQAQQLLAAAKPTRKRSIKRK